jgi:chromosome segregation ATPase
LISQRINPSVDAVRVALGNTGSKTTIHKYLKELEAEDGPATAAGKRSTISDALQDLVERLANRLQMEADDRISAAQSDFDQAAAQRAAALGALDAENSQIRARLSALEEAGQAQSASLATASAQLQKESTARKLAEQHVDDLKHRLEENESHRASLEEKHQHARQALEHYRQSVKEQRDADVRRHDHQIQQLHADLRLAQQAVIVKQDETTRLNQEGAKLASELAHTKQALYEQLGNCRKLESKVETLQAALTRASETDHLLISKTAEAELANEELKSTKNQLAAHEIRVRELEVALAEAHAKIETQSLLSDQLKLFFDKIALAPSPAVDRS